MFRDGPQRTKQTQGSGPQALNCQRVRELPIVLPPFDEQQEIIGRVEELFGLADRLEQRHAKGIRYMEDISRSILAKAFRGKLVRTEAEPIEVEGTAVRIGKGGVSEAILVEESVKPIKRRPSANA